MANASRPRSLYSPHPRLPREPVRLVQPKVMYQFADPELEARSAGQKLLMRMGNANAALVKDKLRALRAELTASPPAPPG